MKHIYLLLISILLFSCGNGRILQLPEIENAKITEIHDVSHAYLFYDETKEDSVELNRKNLIITTNWLVNVDKRLTLAQAIPKIKFLQDKKRSAELHKNEDAKNYFTCSDSNIKNLGFLEFTDVVYWERGSGEHLKITSDISEKQKFYIIFQSLENIQILNFLWKPLNISSNNESIITDFKKLQMGVDSEIFLEFNKNLSFQEYITFKSLISKLKSVNISIDNNEFIY